MYKYASIQFTIFVFDVLTRINGWNCINDEGHISTIRKISCHIITCPNADLYMAANKSRFKSNLGFHVKLEAAQGFWICVVTNDEWDVAVPEVIRWKQETSCYILVFHIFISSQRVPCGSLYRYVFSVRYNCYYV